MFSFLRSILSTLHYYLNPYAVANDKIDSGPLGTIVFIIITIIYIINIELVRDFHINIFTVIISISAIVVMIDIVLSTNPIVLMVLLGIAWWAHEMSS